MLLSDTFLLSTLCPFLCFSRDGGVTVSWARPSRCSWRRMAASTWKRQTPFWSTPTSRSATEAIEDILSQWETPYRVMPGPIHTMAGWYINYVCMPHHAINMSLQFLYDNEPHQMCCSLGHYGYVIKCAKYQTWLSKIFQCKTGLRSWNQDAFSKFENNYVHSWLMWIRALHPPVCFASSRMMGTCGVNSYS